MAVHSGRQLYATTWDLMMTTPPSTQIRQNNFTSPPTIIHPNLEQTLITFPTEVSVSTRGTEDLQYQQEVEDIVKGIAETAGLPLRESPEIESAVWVSLLLWKLG